PPSAPPPPPPPPRATASAPAAPKAPPGTVLRKDLTGFIDAGFARFLQMVEVEPSLEQGKFVGWNIVSLRPPEFWQGVDLKPGDVVRSVNGLPIERETEAFDAFQSLRTAEKISINYQRGGTQRTLDYRVVDEPTASPPTPK
ncbi:MAG TPA: hypothetical protein VM686_24805, partial [Polyangiaceae bacterium]|nr:hypothetical protein [Polyangiaceae bacterium]